MNIFGENPARRPGGSLPQESLKKIGWLKQHDAPQIPSPAPARHYFFFAASALS
ncbi:MAG: hypothetical protein WC003_14260 [Terrimicrobiaceae bacterium]|jgi:hypothetical protein